MKLKTIGEFVKFLKNFVAHRIPQHSDLFNKYLKTNEAKLERMQGQRVTEKWRSEFCTELCNMFLTSKNCPKVHDKSYELLVAEFKDFMSLGKYPFLCTATARYFHTLLTSAFLFHKRPLVAF